MNKKDFSFDAIDNGEYYFNVTGNAQKQLNERFSDTGFRFVNAVVYMPKTDTIKAECFYMFNVMYYEFENEDIKNILKDMYKEIA